MNDAYVQGFIDKCAELGVDPEALMKTAQLPALMMGGLGAMMSRRNGQANPPVAPQPAMQGVGAGIQRAGQNIGQGIQRAGNNLGTNVANTSFENPMGNNPMQNPVGAVPALNMVQRGAGALGGLTSNAHPIQAAGRMMGNVGGMMSNAGNYLRKGGSTKQAEVKAILRKLMPFLR